MEIHIVDDESEFYREPTPKIMYKIPKDRIDTIKEYIIKNKKSPYIVFKTQPIMLEFADERTNKVNALKQFVQDNNMLLENVMSFGDMTNDNEMIRQVGFGVAMANAADDTKAVAKFITKFDNNHDGFARFILNEFEPRLL